MKLPRVIWENDWARLVQSDESHFSVEFASHDAMGVRTWIQHGGGAIWFRADSHPGNPCCALLGMVIELVALLPDGSPALGGRS